MVTPILSNQERVRQRGGDHLNFSFSPSASAATTTSDNNSTPSVILSSTSTNHNTNVASTSQIPYSSSVSPSLTSWNQLNTTTQTISASLSSNLPRSPSPNPTIEAETIACSEEDEEDCEMEEGPGVAGGNVFGKRTAGVMEEDVQRRGPPTSDTPGGDCKSLCVRHQRMANGGTNLMLQKSIENLPTNEQTAVNTIWSLFSAAPSRRRLLILQGLLTIACPSQLTFLQTALTLEMRLDPLDVLPREVSLKVFGYLDAITLGRAAQVSRLWKGTADDDLLWRTMCEQHIEKKCAKCGWGLPSLGERRRKARKGGSKIEEGSKASTSTSKSTNVTDDVVRRLPSESLIRSASPSPPTQSMILDPPCLPSGRQFKRAKTESPAPSRSSTPAPTSPRHASRQSSLSNANGSGQAMTIIPSTRPWKSVYCERLAIERNWRKGTCVPTILTGHTDSITCLQVAEDLPDPTFPVLMTGSWDRSVRIWNLESGKEVGVLRGHTRGVRALQFDALKLVTGSMDSTLKIWNWRTGECLRTLRGHREGILCLTYDKQLLVSGSADNTIKVWDFGTGEVFTLLGHTEWVNSVAIWDSKLDCGTATPASSSRRDSSSLLDDPTDSPTSNPEAAKASSKGKFLFSASDDMSIKVWDLYTRECVRTLKGHVAQVQSLRVISVEEDLGAGIGGEGRTSAGEEEVGETFGHNHASQSQSSRLTTTSSTATDPSSLLSYRNTATPATQLLHPAPSLLNNLPSLDFLGSKKPCVVSASLDNTIKVWDTELGVCTKTLFGHIEGVWDVDVDKLRIVSASHDRTLKIWDKESGRCLHTLVGHTAAVTAVTLQDQYVVTGGDDANVRVWNFAPTS